MKTSPLFKSLLAVAFTGLFLGGAARAATLVYTDGDLFIGFRSASAANDYLVDIGQYTQFDGHPVGYHLAVGNWSTDLVSVFGSGWPTDSNIQWGAAGTHDFSGSTEISNLYATKAEPAQAVQKTGGKITQPWTRNSLSSQTGTSSAIETMAYGDFYGNTSTSDSPTGFIQSAAGSESWASWMPNGANSPSSSFDTWVPTIEAPVLPGTGSGIAKTRIDLFKILPDDTGTNPKATYIGTFTIDASGDVSFNVLANPAGKGAGL